MCDKCVTATQAAYDEKRPYALGPATDATPSLWHAPGERYIKVRTLDDKYDVIDTRLDRLMAVGLGPQGAGIVAARLNAGRVSNLYPD